MMHPKGDNNWLYQNINYGSSSTLAKNNFRQTLQGNDYIMQNRNQSSLKNEQYSNYYNHYMSTQSNTAYSNNYSNYNNYSYVHNQQGMQSSQSAWGVHQTPYCLGPSCTCHCNPPNAAPAKPIQYSHTSYERPSASHNVGRLENPIMNSLSQLSNYNPHYIHPSNYQNPNLNNSQVIQSNKRFMAETSKIQVRNVFELNNTVCNQPDTNIAQRSNKVGQMNCYSNCLPGQNQNQIIPSIQQNENVCSGHGNYNPMKPNHQESIKSVTKMYQNLPNDNPANLNRNNGYYYQNNAPNSLNLTQQFSQNSSVVEQIARERNTFPENIAMENAYRKKASYVHERADSRQATLTEAAGKSKKTLTFAIEQAKTQESTMISTGAPKKSPSVQKNVKKLTDDEIEDSVFLTKLGSKSKTLMKAILARELVRELQNDSNSQRMEEVEEDTPEVITIKDEREDWLQRNNCTVEKSVTANESINKNEDEELYVMKSKFQNKFNKDKLISLMELLSHESFGDKRPSIIQNAGAEKNCSPTLESVRVENKKNSKRKLDENILNDDRKKLIKKASSGIVSLALAQIIDAEDIENLNNIMVQECGLELEPGSGPQSNTFEETKSSLEDPKESEEENSTNIERDDRNNEDVQKESNSGPKEVIVTKKKGRRLSKRSSTDSVKEKHRSNVDRGDKIITVDVGMQTTSEPDVCPFCFSKINEADSENIFKIMRAFHTFKHRKCMSCNMICLNSTFWVNVITCELRCLNCFRIIFKKSDELLK